MSQVKPEKLDRSCPSCRAPRGEPCVSRTGSGTVLEKPHTRRLDSYARRLADWEFEGGDLT